MSHMTNNEQTKTMIEQGILLYTSPCYTVASWVAGNTHTDRYSWRIGCSRRHSKPCTSISFGQLLLLCCCCCCCCCRYWCSRSCYRSLVTATVIIVTHSSCIKRQCAAMRTAPESLWTVTRISHCCETSSPQAAAHLCMSHAIHEQENSSLVVLL